MIQYKENGSYSALGSKKSTRFKRNSLKHFQGKMSPLDSRKSWEDFRFQKEEEEKVTLRALEGSRYR